MRTVRTTPRHTTLATAAALIGLAGVLNAGVAPNDDAEGLVQRVVSHTTRSGIAIRAIRHLEAGAVSGKHHASMDVETSVSSSGAFTYQVIAEEGSERTRDKVFRGLLNAERDAWKAGAHDASVLSPANYQFVTDALGESSRARIQLMPKRADSRLVNGTLTVSADGYPMLLEGRLAKSPSFWVKSVTVVKRYARFNGVSLPVAIESLADVKLFGKATFSMRYRYTEVNGNSVSHSASLDPAASFGPSPQILALYASLHEGQ